MVRGPPPGVRGVFPQGVSLITVLPLAFCLPMWHFCFRTVPTHKCVGKFPVFHLHNERRVPLSS